jgi:hypothetical protein
MDMGTNPLLNILLSFGPMILISQLGSFCACFTTLKWMEPIKESWVLFEFETQNAFFQKSMQGSSHCLNALKLVDKIVGVKPLPRKLFL